MDKRLEMSLQHCMHFWGARTANLDSYSFLCSARKSGTRNQPGPCTAPCFLAVCFSPGGLSLGAEFSNNSSSLQPLQQLTHQHRGGCSSPEFLFAHVLHLCDFESISLLLVKQNDKWQLLKVGISASSGVQTPAFLFLSLPAIVQHVHLEI